MSAWKYFVKFAEDNVVTITKESPINTVFQIDTGEVTILQDTPFGHKIAIKNIEEGEDIIKYGVKIGVSNQKIMKGEHVHIHNVDEVSLIIRDEEKKKSLKGL
jgi:altronate dehydratase